MRHLLLLAMLTAAAPTPTVLVAARPIARGTVITGADVACAPQHGMVLGALVAPDQAIGLVARHALGAGVTIRADALAPAMLVRRGDPVTLRARGRGFTVEALGAASGDAAGGEGVAVVNTSTGTRLRGAVAGEGIVAIGPLRPASVDRNPDQ